MVERTPIQRLIELAEGWECAAQAEQAVMAGFQQWKEQFDADERSAQILRYTRVWVEARDNRERFKKDAAAIRWALATLPAKLGPSDMAAAGGLLPLSAPDDPTNPDVKPLNRRTE